jgi:hypothetical protein
MPSRYQDGALLQGLGRLMEVEVQLQIAENLGYLQMERQFRFCNHALR